MLKYTTWIPVTTEESHPNLPKEHWEGHPECFDPCIKLTRVVIALASLNKPF